MNQARQTGQGGGDQFLGPDNQGPCSIGQLLVQHLAQLTDLVRGEADFGQEIRTRAGVCSIRFDTLFPGDDSIAAGLAQV